MKRRKERVHYTGPSNRFGTPQKPQRTKLPLHKAKRDGYQDFVDTLANPGAAFSNVDVGQRLLAAEEGYDNTPQELRLPSLSQNYEKARAKAQVTASASAEQFYDFTRPSYSMPTKASTLHHFARCSESRSSVRSDTRAILRKTWHAGDRNDGGESNGVEELAKKWQSMQPTKMDPRNEVQFVETVKKELNYEELQVLEETLATPMKSQENDRWAGQRQSRWSGSSSPGIVQGVVSDPAASDKVISRVRESILGQCGSIRQTLEHVFRGRHEGGRLSRTECRRGLIGLNLGLTVHELEVVASAAAAENDGIVSVESLAQTLETRGNIYTSDDNECRAAQLRSEIRDAIKASKADDHLLYDTQGKVARLDAGRFTRKAFIDQPLQAQQNSMEAQKLRESFKTDHITELLVPSDTPTQRHFYDAPERQYRRDPDSRLDPQREDAQRRRALNNFHEGRKRQTKTFLYEESVSRDVRAKQTEAKRLQYKAAVLAAYLERVHQPNYDLLRFAYGSDADP